MSERVGGTDIIDRIEAKAKKEGARNELEAIDLLTTYSEDDLNNIERIKNYIKRRAEELK